MAHLKKFTSKQDLFGFVQDVCESIEESDNDLDLSIILDSEMAEYLYNSLSCSKNLLMNIPDIDNKFGDVSGKCLITVFKNGNVIELLAEDVYRVKDGKHLIKYHEADILVVLKQDIQLVQKYVARRVVVVDFDCEREAIKTLLFD